jgi:hypothetical protein
MTALPGCLDEVSAEWVADVLADKLNGVRSVSVDNLGDGLGQVSELGKLTIDTEAGETKTFVVKTRTNVSDMHEIGITYGMYEREVNFYDQLADELPIRTPDVHYAAWDPKTERVAIIMEFMDGWYSPDQVAGATREEVEKAIRGLAPLTAAYWNSPLRGRVDWLGDVRTCALGLSGRKPVFQGGRSGCGCYRLAVDDVDETGMGFRLLVFHKLESGRSASLAR